MPAPKPKSAPEVAPNNLGLILLIDDNPDDYEATTRSFRKNHFDNPVHWCQSGKDAQDYLYRTGKYQGQASVTRPALILLDLNMPGVDGRQLLRELKSDSALSAIPIIILTTSNDPKDVEDCYALGASTYIQKPVEFDDLTNAMKTMTEYWFSVALLPAEEEKKYG